MKKVFFILIPIYLFINSLGMAARAAGSDEIFSLTHDGENNYMEITIKPGDTGTIDFELSNSSGDKKTNHILIYDSQTAVNGGTKIMTPDNYVVENTAAWFDSNHLPVVLESNQHKACSIGYTVPEETTDGTYTAILALYAYSTDTALDGNEVTLKIDSNYTSTIAIVFRCGDETETCFRLGEDMEFITDGSAGNSFLMIPIDNTGDCYGFPTVEYSVNDHEGKILHAASMKLDIFYRHTSSHAAIPMENGILTKGSYKCKLNVRESRDGSLQDSAEYTFEMDDKTIKEVIRNSMGTEPADETKSAWKNDFIVLGKQELLIGSAGIAGAVCISMIFLIIVKGRNRN